MTRATSTFRVKLQHLLTPVKLGEIQNKVSDPFPLISCSGSFAVVIVHRRTPGRNHLWLRPHGLLWHASFQS